MNLEAILLMVIGVLTAVMAQKNIAVFHDGLRTIIPEYREGRMDKTELVATSFSISIGLILGFGIPISLAGQIILIHSLLLAIDFIGTWVPEGKIGTIMAAITGGLYSFCLFYGLEIIIKIFASLPVNFVEDLGKVGEPVIAIMVFFPILAIAYQYNVSRAGYSFIIVLIIRQLIMLVTPLKMFGWEMNLKGDNVALATGIIILIYFALKEGKVESNEAGGMAALLSTKINRLKKYLPLFALTGGLLGAATVISLLAGNPMSLELQGVDNLTGAGLTYIARGLIFMPVIGATTIATGIYTPEGMKFLQASACFVYMATGSLFLAGIASALTIGAEILLLGKIAVLLDNYPEIKEAGNNLRTALVKVLGIALLVGGALAARSIMGGSGLFIVLALYFFNEQADQPVKRMAIGPASAILVGIIANIFALLGI